MGIAVIEEKPGETAVDDRWETLLHAWREVDMPDGWRAEIRKEGIVLVPPPAAKHNDVPDWIARQLYPVLPKEIAFHQGSGVVIADQARLRSPDIVLFNRAAMPERRGEGIDPDEVLLVAEIASKDNARDDREAKRVEYATAGIPLYLLIDGYDPRGPRITLFSNPRGTDYSDSHAVEWGEPVDLPEPFDIKLDTSEFTVPAD
ncbi:Uma2 family endonuclease [Nocardiopsis potens]|uniref:Uma2 family endonuclease n=1 Tax=Nocardiopsis potens TaxID=1246458 RepID=UPI000345D618|nr:Uma2 family endonuclease [Nocardiopsis potens]